MWPRTCDSTPRRQPRGNVTARSWDMWQTGEGACDSKQIVSKEMVARCCCRFRLPFPRSNLYHIRTFLDVMENWLRFGHFEFWSQFGWVAVSLIWKLWFVVRFRGIYFFPYSGGTFRVLTQGIISGLPPKPTLADIQARMSCGAQLISTSPLPFFFPLYPFPQWLPQRYRKIHSKWFRQIWRIVLPSGFPGKDTIQESIQDTITDTIQDTINVSIKITFGPPIRIS